MKDRIRLIMENEQLTPSAFADKLQLGRAVISHILNGRNNPSLDVVTRILSKINYINSDWLISGNGNMYKSDLIQSEHKTINNEPDLFTQTVVSQTMDQPIDKYRKEIVVDKPNLHTEISVNKDIKHGNTENKKVTKIIIYYSDNTFETFNADNKPL